MSDAAFEQAMSDARASMQRKIAGTGALPDFAGVVAAAHEHAPDVVDEAAVREAGQLAPVMDIRRSSDVGTAKQESELDEIFGDARAALSRRVEERELESIPNMRVLRPRSRRWPAPAAAVIGLLAASLLVWIASDSVREATRDYASAPAEQAALMPAERAETGGIAVEPEPVRVPRAAPAVPEPEPEIEPEPEAPPPPPAPKRASVADLNDDAQRHWRGGDVARAEATFKEVIRRGGRSRHAELAYGDLFAIAHRRHGPAERKKLWSSYLKRFPRGRFADDARAGLCRLEPTAGRGTCWSAYLRDFPRGSYRVEAKAATE